MTSATTPVSGQREPELAGQTVVVIGGSSGIGLETARRARTEADPAFSTRPQAPSRGRVSPSLSEVRYRPAGTA